MSFPEEDITCPVCCDIFTDPVLLSCSHSFCKACVDTYWRAKQANDCPVCRRISSCDNPPSNLGLKNLSDAFRSNQRPRAGPGPTCSQHGEKLSLFCLHDQQPICLICMHSEAHRRHELRPIDEAARRFSQEIQTALNPLQGKLGTFVDMKQCYGQIMHHIELQTQQTEKQMKEEFKYLHEALEKEQRDRLSHMRDESGRKRQKIAEKIAGLDGDIVTLQNTISVTQANLALEDIRFLQTYKSTATRVKRPVPNPELEHEVLDVASHIGNLLFGMLEKLGKARPLSELVLDPNTAHPRLVISEDLTTVTALRQSQQLPDNPERFDTWPAVLGSKGFTSGSHSWVIEVGESTDWGLGVIAKSANRKGRMRGRYWMFCFANDKYTAVSPAGSVNVNVVGNPTPIKVMLDFEKNVLVFSQISGNFFTRGNLYTFQHSFDEEVIPFVHGFVSHPVKVGTHVKKRCTIM